MHYQSLKCLFLLHNNLLYKYGITIYYVAIAKTQKKKYFG